MMPNLEPLNLGSVARGALLELFEATAARVAANIADTSTDAEAPRKITIELTFKPEGDRRAVKLTTTAKATLATISKHVSRIYLGKDDAGKVYLFDQDPRQEVLFAPPVPADNMLDFKAKQANDK
jgi:hypothetical protein